MYVKYPLSLRNVEDLLHERGIDLSYETVRCAALSAAHNSVAGVPISSCKSDKRVGAVRNTNPSLLAVKGLPRRSKAGATPPSVGPYAPVS
jgi:hypothetical protein